MSKRDGAANKRGAYVKANDTTNDENDDMTIAQLATSISEQLVSTKKEITKQLNDEVSSLKSDIKTELQQMRTALEKSVTELSRSVDENKHSIRRTAEALSRSQQRNDLVISSVPFVQGENLMNYFEKWWQTVGFNNAIMPNVDIRRLHKSSMAVGKCYMILVQFAITNQRNDFYFKYLQTRSLSLDQIGFSTNERIFVNENLTVPVRAIKSKALLAKRNGKLHSVTTREGIVYIKKHPQDESRRVDTEDELLDMLQEN
ncbi:uncharacterized protein LOC134210306 [Armigeres subalbatus]|uniref:uncharacterized protein LOC134210306 n=1 Tax=Armigeres subalbatus TaxID=124917 RepID=UPI002ED3DA19